MKRKRLEEIRRIAQKLREAENGAEMAPRLLSDARSAILELLDESKGGFPTGPGSFFDNEDDQ